MASSSPFLTSSIQHEIEPADDIDKPFDIGFRKVWTRQLHSGSEKSWRVIRLDYGELSRPLIRSSFKTSSLAGTRNESAATILVCPSPWSTSHPQWEGVLKLLLLIPLTGWAVGPGITRGNRTAGIQRAITSEICRME